MHNQITDALQRGDHEEALRLARQFVADAPHDGKAHVLLARVERAAGEYEEALASINRAALLIPEDPRVHFERAWHLLRKRSFTAAEAALKRSTDLDPNSFEAYVLRAQLALDHDDFDEAERLCRLASRVSPDHPWVSVLEGMIALHRGDGARAQTLLTFASKELNNDPQVLHALAFAHLQQGQVAFAEQALTRIVEMAPTAEGVRGLLSSVQIRQGRYEDARASLQRLLDDPAASTPAIVRLAARMDIALKRNDSAMALLRQRLAEDPRDGEAWQLITDLWRRAGDLDDARRTIDQALPRCPDFADLWRLRLAIEQDVGDATRAIVERWLVAAPNDRAALEAAMNFHEAHRDEEATLALARRLLEVDPGHADAKKRLLDRLIRDRPDAAHLSIRAMVENAPDEMTKQELLPWLGYAQDRAELYPEAVATWTAFNAAEASSRWPLTEPGPAAGPWPAPAAAAPDAPGVAFLSGLPGSGVEKVASVIGYAGLPLRADRFEPDPPKDALQRPDAFSELRRGAIAPEQVLAEWRTALPGRHVVNGSVIDWLPFWDNGLLKVLGPLLPQAMVLIAVRDPRDMLIDWLAFGSVVPYCLPSPAEAARWMAAMLQHAVVLKDDPARPYAIVRTDHAASDPSAFALQIGRALGLSEIRAPLASVLGGDRVPAGHWRLYASALAEPFALLQDVAVALGYPAD